jgi:hypothetical protein
MSIARKSHRQFVRVFLQLQKWHIMIVRAGEQKNVLSTRPNMSGGSTVAVCAGSEGFLKKFGTAEVKRGMEKVGPRMPRIRRAERKCLAKCHG